MGGEVVTTEQLQAYLSAAKAAKSRAKGELGEPILSERIIDLYGIVQLSDAVVKLVAEVERLQKENELFENVILDLKSELGVSRLEHHGDDV